MMLLVLFAIYIGIQLGFRFFGKGHEYEYNVITGDNHFSVKETFTNNTKNEFNSYYFEIKIDDVTFYYQTLEEFDKNDHVIENIAYYSDNEYKCILPIFINTKIITDIMCLNHNVIYNYQSIQGNNSNLDMFVDTLSDYGYDRSKWIDTAISESVDGLKIYKDNFLKNHYIALATYKGIYTINNVNSNRAKKIDLFSTDVYKRPISIVYKNYYVTANYDEQYRFTKFYVVDLTSNKISEINCEREISFDSYIQGENKDSIYLFDKDNKKQYEINLKTNKVLEVGNENTGIKIYRNNEWQKVSAAEAKNSTLLFDNTYKADLIDPEYIRIDKVGGEATGYYYYYKSNNNFYSVYRSNIKSPSQLTYLFDTTDINRIAYIDDYLYYLDGATLKRFNDESGIRSLIVENELKFNENITFGVYKK